MTNLCTFRARLEIRSTARAYFVLLKPAEDCVCDRTRVTPGYRSRHVRVPQNGPAMPRHNAQSAPAQTYNAILSSKSELRARKRSYLVMSFFKTLHEAKADMENNVHRRSVRPIAYCCSTTHALIAILPNDCAHRSWCTMTRVPTKGGMRKAERGSGGRRGERGRREREKNGRTKKEGVQGKPDLPSSRRSVRHFC